MTSGHFSQTSLRQFPWVILASGIIACSSDSSGLKAKDGSLDGKRDGVFALDAGAIDSTLGQGGAAGSPGGLDAGSEAGRLPSGGGGGIGIDGGMPGRGGASGATSVQGAGGAGGMAGVTGAGGSTRGRGASGGAGTAGTSGTGGRTGGTGGTMLRDAGPAIDAAVDAPLAPDAGIDSATVGRDGRPGRPDGQSIDGEVACGYLDEPCCEPRECNLPDLVCVSGGAGGGTCVACGGANEACCEGDVCTAPNTVCVGGGRGGGTCR
ncbi:MAG: hypothetical protein JXP73_12700 [Deltaproteobacteria bacterium]|nr:hypothetical protein [Deltaproteobacteria bacterium]